MELTRRDAIAALTALGGTGIGYAAFQQSRGSEDSPTVDDEMVETTLVAAAEVIYPSEVEGIEMFVRTFLAGRLGGDRRADRRLGEADRAPAVAADRLRETVATLNDRAEEWHGDSFSALSPSTRDQLLREVGADTADERPDGTTAERVRYYVVNELLLALYASPTGGELVGIENPQGHPGGIDSYQRGPR